MRVVLYARVSTKGQLDKGYSLRQQIEALQDHAQSRGFEIVGEVSEDAKSTTLDRPGLDEVRDLVRDSRVDLVLVQDQDRLSREPAHLYLLEKEFEKFGCKARSINDADDTPEGDLLRGIRAQVSKYERVLITERTRRGKLRRAKEGKVVPAGTPPMGFDYINDTYVPNETMPLVRRIFEMAAAGSSLHGICKTFETEGFRTVGTPKLPEGSRHWNINTIRRTLLNDVYRPHTFAEVQGLVTPSVAATLDSEGSYGIDWYNRRGTHTDGNGKRSKGAEKPRDQWIAVPVVLPGDWITAETVEAARGVIRGFKESRADNRFWELSGHVNCGCGCKLVSRVTHRAIATGEIKHYPYYVCSRYMRDGCEHGKWINADKLETQVYEALRQIQPQDIEQQLDALIRESRPTDSLIAEWGRQLEDVAHRRAKYQEMFVAGVMDMPTLQAHVKELDTRQEAIEGELQALNTSSDRIERLKWLKARIPENPVLAFLGETEDMRRDYYKDLGIMITCSGEDIEITGSQGVALTSTQATRR